ncbi:High affinity methionine permease [Penicillium digitatum]|uniref:High affinity methionine permease n=1 Tax=Penicillium digitatum TaxID=36651 RepID=A0A7T6XU64_PENDI|nr:High affinity methionine permease [Penicillium digitatum]
MGLPSPVREHNEQLPQFDSSDNDSLQYTTEIGGNTSKATYQEVSGAPVEVNSPLGYSVGWVTVVFLNLSKMIGTGVVSTSSTVLKGAGSVGLALIYWVIGYLMVSSSLSVYMEFASSFPSRSGSEVVYLEQSYPRPKYFFPTVFAMQTVLFSFSSSNDVVLAQYLFKLADSEVTPWKSKGVAVACYTVAVLALAFHTRWSLRLANAIGLVKLLTLIFIGITGNAFDGTSTATAYGTTNALTKVWFSFAGYENAFNVVNENPTKTLKWSAPLSLGLTAVSYILANIAYFSAASNDEIFKSKVVAAGVFFEKVFGSSGAAKALDFLICVSAFGNLLAVLIGQSRMLRECGRQGVLPFTAFWTLTRPFGTPLGPYLVKWGLTVIMILAPPAGDAFSFVVDLGVYTSSFFGSVLTIGLVVTRIRRARLNLPPPEDKAWHVTVAFAILSNLYMVVIPWYLPSIGANGGDVSFWYATYCAVAIGIIGLCGLYYYVWIKLLPRAQGFTWEQTVLKLDDGALAHQLVRVPKKNA